MYYGTNVLRININKFQMISEQWRDNINVSFAKDPISPSEFIMLAF